MKKVNRFKQFLAVALSLLFLFSAVPAANATAVSATAVTVAVSLGPLAESLTVTVSGGTLVVPTTGFGPTNTSPTITVTTTGSLAAGHGFVETFANFTTGATALSNGTQTINSADVFLITNGGTGAPFTSTIGTVPNSVFLGGVGTCAGCTAGTIPAGHYSQVDTVSLFIDQTAFNSLIPLTTYTGVISIFANAV